MSLLPETILPATEPIGTVDPETGQVTMDKNWWLFFWNLSNRTLSPSGGGGGTPVSISGSTVDYADMDAVDTDAYQSRRSVENAIIYALNLGPPVTTADLPDLYRALLLAQDAVLPDPIPRAQPVANVAPTGSVFTWTAPFAGTMAVTSGTGVSVSYIRSGTTVVTNLSSGLFPVSRMDQLAITYSGAPVLTFIPWSSQ